MENNWTRGDWFQTFSGVRFYPLSPRVEEITIEDIAHALAHVCRFGGHVRRHYSVAQHSVLVSLNVPPELAMWGLLHDASEAYLGDMVRPLKVHMPDYKKAEVQLMGVIAEKFGLSWPEPAAVKAADMRALMTERRDLLLPRDWEADAVPEEQRILPFTESIRPWIAPEAKTAFLARFRALGGRR